MSDIPGETPGEALSLRKPLPRDPPIDVSGAAFVSEHEGVQLLRRAASDPYNCSTCGPGENPKPVRLVAIPLDDGSYPLCNGCYGLWKRNSHKVGQRESGKLGRILDLIESLRREPAQKGGPAPPDRPLPAVSDSPAAAGRKVSRHDPTAPTPEADLFAFAPAGAPLENAPVEPSGLIARSLWREVDQVAVERAVVGHRALLERVRAALATLGHSTRWSRHIDLLGEHDGQATIYEIKTLTGKNWHGQMRRAVAQLLEYRFCYGLRGADLVLVTPQVLPEPWAGDFLADLGIATLWPTQDGWGGTARLADDARASSDRPL